MGSFLICTVHQLATGVHALICATWLVIFATWLMIFMFIKKKCCGEVSVPTSVVSFGGVFSYLLY